ncbi:hypothetical protein CHY08_18285 [Rhizobium leguminosarum bv. viciae]|uniref:hypothetical protein n=1 Tax=Rhizobium leguminosarum TaxID=384 RepID=UPI000B8D0BB5|nr:hypothetical protein [Rhizobium leguminosarum]ASR08886.1 hypothetical protein CHY08_18285 [Rhizobium leguminosarum bv. viciae]
MTSRIADIIKVADKKCLVLTQHEAAENIISHRNLRMLWTICQGLVHRPKPLKPTVPLIIEEGIAKYGEDIFPMRSTIYNDYPDIPRIWREAYMSIMDMQSVDPMSRKDLDKVDTSIMSEGDRYNFLEIRRLLEETEQQNAALRAIVHRKSPDEESPRLDAIVDGLNIWVDRMDRLGFGLDELSLHVTGKTRPGTIIMDADLFKDIKNFVDDQLRSRKSRRSTDG